MRGGLGSSTTCVTATPVLPAVSTACAANTTCFALYAWPSGLVALSALAMLLATVFRRWLCAAMPEAATLKIENSDMLIAP